jgi:uncharacterized membrane protein YdjX (TVP38/TMEM64 family)
MARLFDRKYTKPLLFILLAGVLAVVLYRQDTAVLLQIIVRHPNWGIILSLIGYTLLGATVIPSEPLTLGLLTLYGPFLAALVAMLGNTLAALLEFRIGGSLGDLAEFEQRKARLPLGLGKIPLDSPVFLLLARMLPGFGPKFVSLACGIYKIPMPTYLWTTLVSNAIGAVVVVAGGYGLLQLF